MYMIISEILMPRLFPLLVRKQLKVVYKLILDYPQYLRSVQPLKLCLHKKGICQLPDEELLIFSINLLMAKTLSLFATKKFPAMKKWSLLFLFLPFYGLAQQLIYEDSVHRFQLKYVHEHEVVTGDAKKNLKFYPVQKQYRITAAFEKDGFDIYKSKDQNRDNYLFVSQTSNKLEKIIRASKTKEKITLLFNSENNIFAEKIQIVHQNIKLKIELNYFKSE